MTARDFFESVAESSRDARRCRRQLRTIAQRPEVIPSYTTVLESRIRAAEAMFARAEAVLEALRSLMAPWVADAIQAHFVDGMRWEDVAQLLGYCESHCLHQSARAFELIDRTGILADVSEVGNG